MPVLLKVQVGETDGRRFEGRVILQDDFGSSQSLSSRWRPLFCNWDAIPHRNAMLVFRIEDPSGKSSGHLEVRNPCHQPVRAFVGLPAPVNASTPAGRVQLRKVVWEHPAPNSKGVSNMRLEFDVSQCGDLLPCHVIGVRISDCWGNSELIQGSASQDGRTVNAFWQPMGSSRTVMQDSHWRVRLALSRGVGAKMPAGRTAVFESIPMGDSHFVQTRAIAAQRFMLNHRGSEKRKVENGMWLNFAYVQLPGARVDDWPVLTRVTGHLAGGGSEVFDPRKVREEFGQFSCHPIRVFNDAHGPTVAATTPTFDLRYWVPATYETVDLEFAIERPEVFEFDVQVADWPEEARR
ncbi:hypothetical protein [Prosthecobacter sp.]|uniref:hypothetical protein n=1 Tax=Prosthecobacter sp. TaxID=1965333 RepID=UPI003782EA06